MREGLFQVLPSVAREVEGRLEVENDFGESLRLYTENFDSVVIACPITTDISDSGLRRCQSIADLPWSSKVRFVPLPEVSPVERLKNLYAVKQLLKLEIERAGYLLFSPYALAGDWPTIAVHEAIKSERPYAIDADVVYEQVGQASWTRNNIVKRALKKKILPPLFQRSYRYCLKHSSLALLQGQDVYNSYSPFCRNPHKTHHMPISKDDFISESDLHIKSESLSGTRALKICYVGRVIDMKGPSDWLQCINELKKNGVNLSATWLGDGSLLATMQRMSESYGLADTVTFAGYVSDRSYIFRTLRDSDIFLFCHKTSESPRCLIESLASGCPLVGYGSEYPKELTATHGGGRFVPVGNWKELADLVIHLNKNRQELREMVKLAGISGRVFERDVTMQHRIDLIKEHLKPGGVQSKLAQSL